MRRLWLPLPFALAAAARLERRTCERRVRARGREHTTRSPLLGAVHAHGGHLMKRLLGVLALAMLAGASPAAAAARADAVTPLSRSERNFVALLRPVSEEPAQAFGVVLFRQPHDAEKIAFLDVWTLGLAPNHSYSLSARQIQPWTTPARERTG
jgi:hypothetical protein